MLIVWWSLVAHRHQDMSACLWLGVLLYLSYCRLVTSSVVNSTELVIADTDVRQYIPINCFIFSLTKSGRRTVTSHNHSKSKKYSPNLNCIKLITAPVGHYVRLDFEGTYHIEKSNDCAYDSLTFQDGAFVFSPVILRLCGEGTMTNVTSTGRYMRLLFTTDDMIEAEGFNLSYSFIPIMNYSLQAQKYKQCYFNVQYKDQGRLEISAKSLATFYSELTQIDYVDCVWDIHDYDTRSILKMWIWVGTITQSTIRHCDDRKVEIYPTTERLYADLKSVSSKCYQITTKYFPGSSRVLFRVYCRKLHMMPTIGINFTTFTEPLAGAAHCSANTFTCEDGRLCLTMDLVCNGLFNCPDGDDESKIACEMKNGSSVSLQFIFIGAAILFFVIVSSALIISAKRVIDKQRQLQKARANSTIIANARPIRLLQQATVRLLLESAHQNSQRWYFVANSHDNQSQHQLQRRTSVYTTRCPNQYAGRRSSTFGRRGSWYLNRSISNLSVCSEPKAKRDASSPTPNTYSADYLSPDAVPSGNSAAMKRMRAAST